MSTSINDYWLAKMRATQASGGAPEEAPVEIEVALDEAAVLEEAEAPVEGDTVPVPTLASRKAEIAQFLTDTQGIDPADLDGLTKSELLDLLE